MKKRCIFEDDSIVLLLTQEESALITIKEPQLLYEKLVEGVNTARDCQRPIIVSLTTKVDHHDAISFFSACKRQFTTRSFWADPKRELILVGLGSAHTYQINGNDRFTWTGEQWEYSLRDAVIAVSDESIPATGPTLLGGFSFDPLKEKTSLWKAFPDAQLTLPSYMYTQYKGTSWLTSNIVVEANDNPTMLAEEIIQDHDELFQTHPSPKQRASSFIKEEINPQAWLKTVESATEEIKKHELEKVVLARELRVFSDEPFSAEATLMRLLDEQTASFVFAFENEGHCFIGASPERLVKQEKEHTLFTCLAGSIKRGMSDSEDRKLGKMLLQDDKNLHEHQLVVDMIKEVALTMCTNVKIPDGPTLFKSRHIQHLFTPITAKATEHSLLAIVEALHPTPALGGAPKLKGVEKIREIEELDRGWYAAPIGWLDYNRNGEFAAAIRSALLQGKEASLFAGVGLVADSNPLSEYDETLIKFKPMLSALGEEEND